MAIGDVGIGSGLGIGESYNVITKTYPIDVLVSLPTNGYYAMDMLLSKMNDKTYDLSTVMSKHIDIGVPFTTYFLHTIASYHMTSRFILPPDSRLPTDSIINTLYWSWATVLDQTYRNILEAVRGVNVAKADSTDLDIIGNVYHLRRLVNEDDENYRKRLVTQTSVLIGHGTREACESIINQAIGIDGGCSVVTAYPGAVRIEFNEESIRNAYLLRDTLEQIIPNMLAAGTEWELYTPMSDYLMDVITYGKGSAPYTMDTLLSYFHNITYTVDIVNVLPSTKILFVDGLFSKPMNKTFPIRVFVNGRCVIPYNMNVFIMKTFNRTLITDVMISKYNLDKTILMDNVIKRENIMKPIDFDMFSKKRMRRGYHMSMVVA